MQKKDWIVHIGHSLNMGSPFVYSSVEQNNSQLLFACDHFRRKNHDVSISITPSIDAGAIIHVVIHPYQTCIDVTAKRETTCEYIINQLKPEISKIRVRGCGCAIDTVLKFTAWAINNGWYTEKNMMNTLTHINQAFVKKKNTTFQIVLRRGSQPDTI